MPGRLYARLGHFKFVTVFLGGQDRLLALEQKDQENEMMKQYLNKLCEEEAENIARKREEQAALRDELKTCNAEIVRRKELAKEQEKIIEQRVIQFQEEKAVCTCT